MTVVALLTDFGAQDWFVAAMKGVILGINPRATIVDITHQIPPGDIRAGAFALMACAPSFPKRTVFAAVVDPGVGSGRGMLAAEAGGRRFVGPDNGILSLALGRAPRARVHALIETQFMLPRVSSTFHGRDIVAPAAAHLSMGVTPGEFGPAQKDYVRLDWPHPEVTKGRLTGEIVHIDRFGNAITSIDEAALARLARAPALARCAGRPEVFPLRSFYQEVADGEGLAVLGSAGFIEISVNGADAAAKLGLTIGDAVEVW